MKPKILIVDDDARKMEVLRTFLVAEGIRREDVYVAVDAAAARRLLNGNSFDLMLLDVLLPSREGSPARAETSLELLKEIVEDGTSPVPKHIVAITADEKAMAESDHGFRSMTTQILHVEVGESSWQHSLKVLVARVSRELAQVPKYDYDVCIQCALRVPEHNAVIESWGAIWEPEESLAKGVLVRRGTLQVGDALLRVACAHASRSGVLPTSHLAQTLIAEFRPRLLMMSGICGGVGEKIRAGDVVVADKSWDWQSGKWNERRELVGEIDQKDASPDLIALARGVDVEAIYEGYCGVKPTQVSALHVAPMVTGSSVISNQELHATFMQQHRKVAAVDMECFGLYSAAHVAQEPGPRTLCVKGVSDLADHNKDDKYQTYCSHLSARVLLLVVERWFALQK